MATTYDFLQGKAKWCKLTTPDTAFGDSKWKLTLYPNAASYEKILKLKEAPAIMNVIQKDEDGYYINISRKTSIVISGKVQGMDPPVLLDGSRKTDDGQYMPLPSGILIGNGSDVTVKIEIYTWPKKGMKSGGRAIRLKSVLVNTLIPFEIKKDFSDGDKEAIQGLDEQPEQLF